MISNLAPTGANSGWQRMRVRRASSDSAASFVFHLFAALAEFERGIICERTMAGLEAAKAGGQVDGHRR